MRNVPGIEVTGIGWQSWLGTRQSKQVQGALESGKSQLNKPIEARMFQMKRPVP